jgi:hypothetical protein
MSITITIDQQNGQLVLDLEALHSPPPHLLYIAIALMEELNERLHHDSEHCPDCQARLAEAHNPVH